MSANQMRYDPTAKSQGVQQLSASHAWGMAFGMMQSFKYIRGLWPPGAFITNYVIDQSGCGNHVQPNGVNASLNYWGGTGRVLPTLFELLTTAGNFNNVAAEANYRAATATGNGVTVLCWARVQNASAVATHYLIDKSQTANQKCYSLRVNNLQPEFMVSVDGVNTTLATAAVKTAAFVNEWHFYAGVHENGGNTEIYCDTERVTVAGPATVFGGTSPFYIGYNLQGLICLAALTVFPLPVHVVRTFYEMTRPIFGNVRP